jgi:DNA-binding NarL/FixJ family response regulator
MPSSRPDTHNSDTQQSPHDVIAIEGRLAAHPPQTTVVVAASHGLVRAGMRRLLEDQHDIAVTGEATTGDDVLALVERVDPDVVVIDFELPPLDGVELTREVLSRSPRAPRVVLLIGADNEKCMIAALEAGATGVLARDSDAPELSHAVRVVAGGGSTLGPAVTESLVARLLSSLPGHGTRSPELAELTPREREVMGLVAMGLSNTEIAERLVVTPATAKTHVSRARRKIGARDRAQLVVYAYETGLVAPSFTPDHAEARLRRQGHGQWPSTAYDGLPRAS